MVLLSISFVAGVLTVLAPCVLPLLPVVVGGSVAGERHWRRAYVITVSLGLSVVLFTLLLKVSTALINVPQSFWELLSGGILVAFGLVMIFPRAWDALPFVNRLNRGGNELLATGYRQNSIWGDTLMGVALGPVFTSCSPTYFVILATVLPASFAMGLVDLVAYAVGLSGFLLVIAIAGQRAVGRLGVAIRPDGWFRRGIGVLFIAIGVLIATGVLPRLEVWLIERGFAATRLEQYLLIGTPKDSFASARLLTPEEKEKRYVKAPELVSPDGYLNTPDGSKATPPITIGEFKGKKVVLVDIWTYTCINCRRTLPYLESWYEKYHDAGLEIIGVHTPEFSFERKIENVSKAVKDFGLQYRVVLDNEYKTWNAFGNHFWPRKYLVDIDGYIVYDHAGEGAYEETEKAIQKALAERAERLGIKTDSQDVSPPGDAIPVDFSQVRSPEVYFGSDRNELLGNGAVGLSGPQGLEVPEKLFANTLYLGGAWDIQPEYARNTETQGNIRFIYTAKNVYMVASASAPIRVKVTRDGGQALGAERGADVGEDGWTTIHEERLYKLVEGKDYKTHLLEITIEGTGVTAYTLTF